MRIQAAYAAIIQGSKVGAGVQGECDRERLAETVDRVLVLDESLESYAPRFGSRLWLRVVHDAHNWKNPHDWARHCAIRMATAYQYGCRDLITINEPIALEGLGDAAADYRWLNQWGVQHVAALRGQLEARGCPNVRVWGPALSPGHREDDDFEGYRLLADYLQALDGIAGHYYWGPGWGFIGDADFEWWAGRIERAHNLLLSIGVDRPFAITEFNRKVNRSNAADVALYADECKRYYRWVNSLDYVVAAFTFLYTNRDPGFDDLTWEKMPGMLEYMSDGWDRLSEGEWAQPASGGPDATPEAPRFILGFAEYAAGRQFKPLENERPDAFGNAYQQIENAFGLPGLLRYDRASNTIAEFWRHDD